MSKNFHSEGRAFVLRVPFLVSFLSFFVFAVLSSISWSQDSSEAVGDGDGKPDRPPSHLRAWLLPAEAGEEVSLLLRPSSSDEARPMASVSSGQSATGLNYTAIAGAAGQLELSVGGRVVAVKPWEARPGFYYTAIGRKTGGKWEVATFQDGPAKGPTSQRPLRVLNLASGRQTQVRLDQSEPVLVPADAMQQLDSPAKLLPVSVSVLDPEGGIPTQSSLVVDLAELSSAYVVVAPDRKGRLRPQLLAGAPSASLPVAQPAQPEEAVEETPQDLKRHKLSALAMELDYLSSQLALVETYASTSGKAAGKRSELQKEITRVRAAIKAAEAAPVPANSDQRPPS